MLEIRGLTKRWPGFDLAVDLTLEEGEIGAILGPSGCGKSTLLRIVAGLERPDAGSIRLGAARLDGLPPERRGVGMVFQDFALFPQMSVRGNIEYGLARKGLRREERRERALLLARGFGLGALAERRPASLSGGEQQRTALARTLAPEPRLVLLDEPLSSLDSGTRRRLRSEIAQRLKSAGVTALHVTHDVEEALAVADRVFVMRGGRIVESGKPERIFERPDFAWTARFMGRGPTLPARVDGGTIATSAPRSARTPIGDFEFVRDARSEQAGFEDLASERGPGLERDRASRPGPGLALFFPADSVVPLPPGSEAGPNRFEGVVRASAYAGRFRRIELECGRERMELELPPEIDAAVGGKLGFMVPAARCSLLREDEPDAYDR